MRPAPKDIDEYTAGFPAETRNMLQSLRAAIKKCVPRAAEAIVYRMPTFKLAGKNLVHFAGFKHHIGFYPTPSAIKKFETELSRYKNAKGSVQFPLDAPMPLGLVGRMARFRAQEVAQAQRPKTCSRGHRFTGSGPCPVCWPGHDRKKGSKGARNGKKRG